VFDARVALTWAEIFCAVGPSLMRPATPTVISTTMLKYLQEKKGHNNRTIMMFFDTDEAMIKIQLMALGLIDSRSAEGSSGGVNEFLSLTSRGRRQPVCPRLPHRLCAHEKEAGVSRPDSAAIRSLARIYVASLIAAARNSRKPPVPNEQRRSCPPVNARALRPALMISVPASMHRATIAMSFFTSGGEVSCARATLINMQSIPIAIAQACQDGIAVSCASLRCVRLTAIRPTVVPASGHTDQGTPSDMAGVGACRTVSSALISLGNRAAGIDTDCAAILFFWRARRERSGPVTSFVAGGAGRYDSVGHQVRPPRRLGLGASRAG
jgi:hypothetical protein